MTKKSINIYGNRHPKRGALVANPIPKENIFWYDIFQPIVDAINKLYTGASNVFKSSETIWLGVDNTINVNKEIFNKIGDYSLFGGQNIPCATINGQQIIGNDGNIIIKGNYIAGDNIEIIDTTINILGYRYNNSIGAFAEGDRDIIEDGTTYLKSSATGIMSHAEGSNNNAIGRSSHAEGYQTESRGNFTHTEGRNTLAQGVCGHAEGYKTTSKYTASHAEGQETTASAENSHAEGYGTITKNVSEHAEGKYNSSNKDSNIYGSSGNTQHSIGIGTANNARKNAIEIMQNGDVYVYNVGNYDGIHIKGQNGAPSGLKTLKEVIDGKQDVLTAGSNITIQNGVISATDTTYNIATTISNGLMSYNDKIQLNQNTTDINNLIWEIIRLSPPKPNQIKYKTTDNTSIIPNYTGDPSIDLPDIKDNAYLDDFGLITFKDVVNFIGNSSFRGLTTMWYVEIPETVNDLLERCFEGTKLREITIPRKIISIGDIAFANCSFLSIVRYNGTMNEFRNITLGVNVFINTQVTEIICIDGVINL